MCHRVRSAIILGLAAIVLLPVTGHAALIRVDFSGDVFSSSEALAGATGSVVGYALYNTEGVPSQTLPAIYSFTGSPYVFNVNVPGLGLLTADSLYSVVGDDGSNTPYDLIDMFSIGASHLDTSLLSDIWVEIQWSGPTDSFVGESIPAIEELQALSTVFAVYQHGNPHSLLSALVTTQFTVVVPLPAAGWLFGSGVLGLLGLTRVRTWH